MLANANSLPLEKVQGIVCNVVKFFVGKWISIAFSKSTSVKLAKVSMRTSRNDPSSILCRVRGTEFL